MPMRRRRKYLPDMFLEKREGACTQGGRGGKKRVLSRDSSAVREHKWRSGFPWQEADPKQGWGGKEERNTYSPINTPTNKGSVKPSNKGVEPAILPFPPALGTGPSKGGKGE